MLANVRQCVDVKVETLLGSVNMDFAIDSLQLHNLITFVIGLFTEGIPV